MMKLTTSLANRRCIVLGSGGFIGINLSAALVKADASVIGVDLRPPSPLLPPMEWHTVRLERGDELEGLLEPGDTVFHLASNTVPGSALNPYKDTSENVLPTLRLLESCVRKGVARIVFLSSGGTIYGPNVSVPISEEAAENPISWYGIQKLTIEKYLGVYRRLHALDSIILRVANPFGPHQRNPKQGLVASIIRHALAGTAVEIFGDGTVTRDYVYIDDVVDAILLAGAIEDRSAPRIYNIGSGVGRTALDVIGAVQAAHGQPIKINYLPSRAIDVPVNILDIARAAAHLRWRPRTAWEQAIRTTYAWARAAQASKVKG